MYLDVPSSGASGIPVLSALEFELSSSSVAVGKVGFVVSPGATPGSSGRLFVGLGCTLVFSVADGGKLC